MKYSLLLLSAVTLFHGAIAHPGHGKQWSKKLAEIKERAARPANGPNDSNELLGDLIRPGPKTQVGKDVAGMLMGTVDAQSDARLNGPVAKLGSRECAADRCCVMKYIADEMTAMFRGPSGRCTNPARGAVRLGFHDAGTWAKGSAYGGADGSIILTDEVSRPINMGLSEIVDITKGWYNKYKQYNASAADIVQLGANVATVVCPLGPRIRTFVGRVDNAKVPPEGLLPDVNDSADQMIKLFEDKTIKPHGLAALVGAHTTSQQRFFDKSRALDPQDSTPGVWDVKFYPQTLQKNAPGRVLKFPSDVVLSTHPRVADEWKEFAGPGGQEHWNDDYAKEYLRLSMLGVNNINDMVECTKVLPAKTERTFNPADRDQIRKWSNGGYRNAGRRFGELVSTGQVETNQTLMQNGIDIADGGPLPPAEVDGGPNAPSAQQPSQQPGQPPRPDQPQRGQPNQQPNQPPRPDQPQRGQPNQQPNQQPGQPPRPDQPPRAQPDQQPGQPPRGQQAGQKPGRPQQPAAPKSSTSTSTSQPPQAKQTGRPQGQGQRPDPARVPAPAPAPAPAAPAPARPNPQPPRAGQNQSQNGRQPPPAAAAKSPAAQLNQAAPPPPPPPPPASQQESENRPEAGDDRGRRGGQRGPGSGDDQQKGSYPAQGNFPPPNGFAPPAGAPPQNFGGPFRGFNSW